MAARAIGGGAGECSSTPLPPQQLWRRVEEVYASAQESGAAFKTQTRTEVFVDATPPGISFVLRVAAALGAKPKGPEKQSDGKPKAWVNPFLPYEEALWVAHLSPSHTLLLNKFNVVEKHVLVVTREFESQADPLNARDLGGAMQVLRAMPSGGVAFYNCGEHSGRSQPHKHLQVVPLPFADDGAPSTAPPIACVVDAATAATAPLEVVELRALPFRAYAARLPDRVNHEQLEATADRLLAACGAGMPTVVSYNVVLWCGAIMFVPRSQECAGPCAINSLGFAGTILVRSEEDLSYVKQTGPLNMLASVAVPW